MAIVDVIVELFIYFLCQAVTYPGGFPSSAGPCFLMYQSAPKATSSAGTGGTERLKKKPHHFLEYSGYSNNIHILISQKWSWNSLAS